MSDITVLVADDDTTTRTALAALLHMTDGVRVVADAGDGAQAVDGIRTHNPDIALVDYTMPAMDGIEVCRRTRECDTATILLTASAEPGLLRRALDAGVQGFVTKNTAVDDISRIIVDVHGGQSYIDPDAALAELDATDCPLRTREREILRLVVPGTRIKEIASTLCLSTGTVRNYLTHAMATLQAKNRHEAAFIARANGWI